MLFVVSLPPPLSSPFNVLWRVFETCTLDCHKILEMAIIQLFRARTSKWTPSDSIRTLRLTDDWMGLGTQSWLTEYPEQRWCRRWCCFEWLLVEVMGLEWDNKDDMTSKSEEWVEQINPIPSTFSFSLFCPSLTVLGLWIIDGLWSSDSLLTVCRITERLTLTDGCMANVFVTGCVHK